MEVKAPNYDTPKLDACGNTTIAEVHYNNMRIPLCTHCLDSLKESLKMYDDTIFCYKCNNFIMSKYGWEYGGSCLKSIDDKSSFNPNDTGHLNFKECMDTCDDAKEREINMKITENFVDCVYGNDLNEDISSKVRFELLYKLPDLRIAELADILAVDTKNGMFVIKIRMCIQKEDESIDIEKIHDKIIESDFIEISKDDYKSIKDPKDLYTKTTELIKPGTNVIFRIKDLDINKLISK